ncbi:hypothetical protein HPB50_012999 [Hyalomma asiaticum]|uniref:Uncharacterized protein n=1 Tax=Hyalomma asiaticum TaxID=266040 RepID=A0ACB7S9A6_HYAAI|nr:hypothetical protein HPB50_012999 [Hyalomma asiaticum]
MSRSECHRGSTLRGEIPRRGFEEAERGAGAAERKPQVGFFPLASRSEDLLCKVAASSPNNRADNATTAAAAVDTTLAFARTACVVSVPQ